MVFVGDHLELNFDGSAGGSARVEIQDVDGLPIPGFAEAEAAQVLGNSTRALVTWKTGSDVSSLGRKNDSAALRPEGMPNSTPFNLGPKPGRLNP